MGTTDRECEIEQEAARAEQMMSAAVQQTHELVHLATAERDELLKAISTILDYLQKELDAASH